jgi:iron(III) transport system ATP-binding protein
MFLDVRELSFGYGGTLIPSLRKLSFGIQKGEIVGIVGPSGSGKSTLLRLIAGFERPLEGSIVLEEITVAAKNIYVPPELRNVGMVFQDYGLFPHMTVRKNIEFGLRRLKKEERAARADEMMVLAQMENFSSRYPYELSGGQQQRVALIRALAPRPRLLLMDEPFSNLDADLREIMRKEVKAILEKEKITCLFVSHDHRDVDAICSRTITQTR